MSIDDKAQMKARQKTEEEFQGIPEKMFCGKNVLGQHVCCKGQMRTDVATDNHLLQYWRRTGDIPNSRWSVLPGSFEL